METVIKGAGHLEVTPGRVVADGLPAGDADRYGRGRRNRASVADGGPTDGGVSRRMWEMAGRWMRPGMARWPSGLLASVLLVAAISGLFVSLRPWLVPLRVLYLLAVMPVAVVWGTRLAVLTAVLSVVAYQYLLIPPIYSFNLADWRSAIALGVFLVTAVVVGGLAAGLKRAAVESGCLSQQQAALRRVATLVARGAPPPEVFSAVAHELAEEFDATLTVVLRYEDDATATVVGGWGEPGIQIPIGRRLIVAGHGVAVSVRQTGASARAERFDGPPGSVARFLREAGATTSTGSPITVEGSLWGVAVAASRNAGAFAAGTETRIADFTELVAAAIANAETQAQLIQSRARLVTTADRTRQKIERDLHDGAQQRLVSLTLQLRAAQAAVPAELGQLGAQLECVTTGLKDALDELREYARGIHPAILTERGLGSALKSLARRCPIPVDLDIRTDGRLPRPIEVAAYYVVSEALANAAKHANAPQAIVHVEAVTGALRVSVRDDGRGGAGFTGGTGLVGLKDRVEALGGRIWLHSPPGAGTTLRVELPLTNVGAVVRTDQRMRV
jgi:signal transduction histidine kinase